MLNQLLVYSFVTLMSIVVADDFVLLLWNNVPRRNPVSRTNPNIFKSITAARGQVPVSSRTRTRVCAGTRVPEQRTELFTGIKADMHTEKSGEKKHERNGMGFVAMMRRSSCV